MSSFRSLLSLRYAVLFLLPGFLLTVFAQDEIFITVSSSSGKVAVVEGSKAVSSSVTEQAVTKPVTSPAAQPAKTAVAETESVEPWKQELLRDPFWPVGFFPEGWKKDTSAKNDVDQGESDWKAASGKIKISGTSKLNGNTCAIINGELKSVGDQIDILQAGRTYQWQVIEIGGNGQVQMKKLGVK